MEHMAKDTLTFRIEPDTKAALDALAGALDRDRSYIINEAVDAYLDTQRWQIAHIKQGMKEADEGKFVSDRQMKTLVNRLLRK
jgi:predicted transcriptional regulator